MVLPVPPWAPHPLPEASEAFRVTSEWEPCTRWVQEDGRPHLMSVPWSGTRTSPSAFQGAQAWRPLVTLPGRDKFWGKAVWGFIGGLPHVLGEPFSWGRFVPAPQSCSPACSTPSFCWPASLCPQVLLQWCCRARKQRQQQGSASISQNACTNLAFLSSFCVKTERTGSLFSCSFLSKCLDCLSFF